ncbi:APC family permease [Hydrogenivirga sp.]
MGRKEGKLSLWEAVSMAVGTMVGAGIFSILGVGAQICGQNLPIAFVLAAVVSYCVAYSYAKLGSTYVSDAGPIEFILRGMGNNALTGTLSVLMWFSYVVSISLFAKAFAGYMLALLGLELTPILIGITEALIVGLFTVLNFFGSKAVGRAEFWIVLVKLSVLLTFVVLGAWSIKPEFLKPALSAGSIVSTFFAASVLFLTYMGFGLITNASEHIDNPKVNVPKAIYISISIVALIYVSVAVVAQGNLGTEGLVRAKEYALAEAAKPFLGQAGFLLVSLGALFSTSSAINATLYGGANVAYVLAKKGQLPATFERKVWFNEPEGLYITSVLSLLFALGLNLSGISSLISFVFLTLYLFVIASHYRLVKEAGGSRPIIMLNFLVVASVYMTLLIYQWSTQRRSFFVSVGVVLGASVFELLYRRLTSRSFTRRQPAPNTIR